MNEKIEINTLITKHENKCKGCRFEMIDVEDPLWEYGSPLKRVLIDNQTGETYDSVSELVGLLNEQQELIEELQVSDEMGWKRAERFEKKCPKELHNKKMYIKRLEYKVQKFKEENEQLKNKLEVANARSGYYQRMLEKWCVKDE